MEIFLDTESQISLGNALEYGGRSKLIGLVLVKILKKDRRLDIKGKLSLKCSVDMYVFFGSGVQQHVYNGFRSSCRTYFYKACSIN